MGVPDLSMSATSAADGTVEVALRGVLDAATSPLLRQLLGQLHQDGTSSVVLNLADLSFIDSAGLGVLIAAVKRYRCHGASLAIRNPTRHVSRVFETTGVGAIFGLNPNLDGHPPARDPR